MLLLGAGAERCGGWRSGRPAHNYREPMAGPTRLGPRATPWPYGWRPRDERHAVYEAKVSGFICVSGGLLSLAGALVLGLTADEPGE